METHITTTEYTYTAVFEPAEEGGYVVTFPALPAVITEGETLEEARAMAVEALHAYIESLALDGISPPLEKTLVRVRHSFGRPSRSLSNGGMARLPVVTPRQVISALGRAGFHAHHVRGSHHVLKHWSEPARRVVVAYHTKAIKRGTLLAILRQADLSVPAFRELLRR